MTPVSSLPACALSLLAVGAAASDSGGPVALGMGGSRIASVDDSTAVFVNPAAFGFLPRGARIDEDDQQPGVRRAMEGWSATLPDVSVGFADHGKLGDYIERLTTVDFRRLQDLGATSSQPVPNDLVMLVTLADMLQHVDVVKDVLTVDGSVGLFSLRAWNIGLGVRGHLNSTLSLSDLQATTNLGIDLSRVGGSINNAINSVPTTVPAGYMPVLITPAQSAALSDPSIGLDANAIARLDIAMNQAGLSAQRVSDMIGTLANPGILTQVLDNAGSGSFSNNTSSILVRGVTYAELPLSAGYAVNDWLAVGGAVKLLVGKNGAAKLRIANGTSSVSGYVSDALSMATTTVTYGIDLGAMLRLPWMQFGLTGRNLNNPTFKGGSSTDSSGASFHVGDAVLARQFTAGAALFPCSWLTVEGNLDLHPITAATFEYRYQYANLGVLAELSDVCALRAGYSCNLAESDVGPMVHAGLGVNLGALRADVAAAMSLRTVNVHGTVMPRAVSLSAGLAVEF